MVEKTTIQVTDETVNRLEVLKVHPREPWNDVVVRLLDSYEKGKSK
jgi:hypothetical protein